MVVHPADGQTFSSVTNAVGCFYLGPMGARRPLQQSKSTGSITVHPDQDRRPLLEFYGSPRACGKNYGASQAEAIRGFLEAEAVASPNRLRLARRCLQTMPDWKKPIQEFVTGMSQGSGIPLTEIVRLLLHEELIRVAHCTAFGATGAATRNGAAIIGQNWDWSAKLYPWPTLLRLRTDAMPATLTYAYPGLWSAAGINEHGLALVWTSAGYRPKVVPHTGVPTYVLIAEILACRDCREAIELLRKTRNAGCFIFFLADAAQQVWVVEGLPGHVECIPCSHTIGRANHYELEASCSRSRQDPTLGQTKSNTFARAQRMTGLLKKFAGRIDTATAQAILADHAPAPKISLCRHPTSKSAGMTIDSFYAIPSRREFWLARGLPCRHDYHGYRP